MEVAATRAINPTIPSMSIAPYPIGRMCASLEIIFGVVPDAMSEWNPDIEPHAIVMNANGNIGPGTIGPPPAVYCVRAGILKSGCTKKTPMMSVQPMATTA